MIKNWPRKLSPLDIRSFLSLACITDGLLRGFIHCYTFDQVDSKKGELALILTLLQGFDGFVIYCDASLVSLGCILMQNDKVIAYDLRQLKVHE